MCSMQGGVRRSLPSKLPSFGILTEGVRSPGMVTAESVSYRSKESQVVNVILGRREVQGERNHDIIV